MGGRGKRRTEGGKEARRARLWLLPPWTDGGYGRDEGRGGGCLGDAYMQLCHVESRIVDGLMAK